MKTTEKQIQLIKEVIDNTRYLCEIDVLNAIEYSNDIECLFDDILERIQEYEIIYYSNAIKFLSVEDQSLSESLEIASEYGYTIENLNSEILASLLIQRYMIDELSEVIDELKQILEEEETEEN